MRQNSYILSLGSNLGDQSEQIKLAVDYLKELGHVNRTSSEFVSEAMGFSGPDFINIAVVLETQFSPLSLLEKLKQIELKMGRVVSNSKGYTSRIIDIDIISFNNEVFSSNELNIPHKEMGKRNFVLVPLKEVCPNWVHPISHESIDEMLNKIDICT